MRLGGIRGGKLNELSGFRSDAVARNDISYVLQIRICLVKNPLFQFFGSKAEGARYFDKDALC